PTESGGADQREKRKKDRRGGVGWRSDGGRGNSLARVMKSPFAPDTGAPTTQGSSPVGAPPPVRTACPARPNAPPHIAPATRAPTNPTRDAPLSEHRRIAGPPPVRTACPARPNAPPHLAPATGAPTSGGPL